MAGVQEGDPSEEEAKSLDAFMSKWASKQKKGGKAPGKKRSRIDAEVFREEKAVRTLQNFIRHTQKRIFFKRYYKEHLYRTRVVKELLQTEDSYINVLDAVVNNFVEPLRENNLLTEIQIVSLFSNIDVISRVNTTMRNDLAGRISEWNIKQIIGDIFLLMTDFFRVYMSYVNNYDHAVKVLKQLREENEEFSTFCTTSMKKIKGHQMDLLESLLITPVQRIPRYEMLLKDLVKHTWPSHPDHPSLVLALSKIQSTAQYINAKVTEAKNREKIVEIQGRVVNKSTFDFFDASRRFIKEGILKQYSSESKKKHKVYCILFNDSLVTCKHESKVFGHTNKWEFETVFPFSSQPNLIVLQDKPAKGLLNAFQLKTNDSSLTLCTDTPEERKEWTDELTTMIMETVKKWQFYEAQKGQISESRADAAKALIMKKYTTIRIHGSETLKRTDSAGSTGSSESGEPTPGSSPEVGPRLRNWTLKKQQKVGLDSQNIHQMKEQAQQDVTQMLLEEQQDQERKQELSKEKAKIAMDTIFTKYTTKEPPTTSLDEGKPTHSRTLTKADIEFLRELEAETKLKKAKERAKQAKESISSFYSNDKKAPSSSSSSSSSASTTDDLGAEESPVTRNRSWTLNRVPRSTLRAEEERSVEGSIVSPRSSSIDSGDPPPGLRLWTTKKKPSNKDALDLHVGSPDPLDSRPLSPHGSSDESGVKLRSFVTMKRTTPRQRDSHSSTPTDSPRLERSPRSDHSSPREGSEGGASGTEEKGEKHKKRWTLKRKKSKESSGNSSGSTSPHLPESPSSTSSAVVPSLPPRGAPQVLSLRQLADVMNGMLTDTHDGIPAPLSPPPPDPSESPGQLRSWKIKRDQFQSSG